MDKLEVMRTVVDDLYATERSIDDAIAQSTDFIATLIQSRRDVNLSAVVGAEAQSKMMEAVAAMATARNAVVAAHADLSKVQRLVGLGHVATGPVDKPAEDCPVHEDGCGRDRNNDISTGRRLRIAGA